MNDPRGAIVVGVEGDGPAVGLTCSSMSAR